MKTDGPPFTAAAYPNLLHIAQILAACEMLRTLIPCWRS